MIKTLISMAKLHSKSLGHFDLKPENILMRNQFSPVMADFGFTKTFLTGAFEADYSGTEYFMGKQASTFPKSNFMSSRLNDMR